MEIFNKSINQLIKKFHESSALPCKYTEIEILNSVIRLSPCFIPLAKLFSTSQPPDLGGRHFIHRKVRTAIYCLSSKTRELKVVEKPGKQF